MVGSGILRGLICAPRLSGAHREVILAPARATRYPLKDSMTLTERIASTVFTTLNVLTPEEYQAEDATIHDLYESAGTAILADLAEEGYEPRSVTLDALTVAVENLELNDGTIIDSVTGVSYDSVEAWLLAYITPPEPAHVRHTDAAREIEGFLVSPIGADWFVTGTANVDVATGAIIGYLTELQGDGEFPTEAARGLISSTPVGGDRWEERDGALVKLEEYDGTVGEEFAGVLFSHEAVAAADPEPVYIDPVADTDEVAVAADEIPMPVRKETTGSMFDAADFALDTED